jgi:F420-non-reducing hydrogenase large subunit
MLRVVAPDGHEWARFHPGEYQTYIEEHAEPWTYMKFCHLKSLGWHGFRDGLESGIYSVAPLARLNAAEGMATPVAEEAYLEFFGTLGKPVHYTLANHWARVIELLYAAERMNELAHHPDLTDPDVRVIPTQIPREGIGAVEAPRGTLFHHYRTDEQGIITKANLLVATQNNAARIALSVEKAARGLISASTVDEGVLNMVEMAFRAYDPCLGCATHALPGSMPLWLSVRDRQGNVVATLRRDYDGSVHRD